MSRFDSATNEAAAARPSVRLFIACDLDFASGHVRAHDGIGTISFGGHDYDGVGKLGGIQIAEESVDVITRPLSLTISGVDAALVTTAMTEQYQGREATLYLGLVDNDSNQLVDAPEVLWRGFMNQMSIKLAEALGEIVLTCENRMRREPRIARYTHEDQQLLYPGDRFFDLIGKISGYAGKWGAQGMSYDSTKSWGTSSYAKGHNG